jgi:hypothetical protein
MIAHTITKSMRSVIRSCPRNLKSSADRLISITLPLACEQTTQKNGQNQWSIPVHRHIPKSLAAHDLNNWAPRGRGEQRIHGAPSLFYRPLTRRAANLKLAASPFHMLVCGYDRLICRGPGDRLYWLWYPRSPGESSNNSKTEVWQRCVELTDLPHLVCSSESFADTVPNQHVSDPKSCWGLFATGRPSEPSFCWCFLDRNEGNRFRKSVASSGAEPLALGLLGYGRPTLKIRGLL